MTTTQTDSPFLGPRAFQAGETLYGRDYESRALLSMLIAERIVLLHSPSGAGKTSLIQAVLIPMLAEREFLVLPTVRVGQEPPPGWAGNRYARAMLLSLEEGRPTNEQIPLEELDSLTLAAYLARRAPAEADTVLVVDQFEEVLTRDPTDGAAKQAFFRELGNALRARQLWVLFVVREEYVAALEQYARHIPTRLNSHFRLDLLGVAGATEALREPPRRLGVDFPKDLVARLVDDLRRVNVQQADGTIIQQLGPSVEPVQLQVIGLRLWERLPAGATAISAAELDALGDVGTALGDYYAERVAATTAATGVSERALRGWFERALITPQGVRGQVLQGAGESAGLPNTTIARLIDAYLVRAEARRGATWYELAHDRLIAPVRASNAAWFAANLSTLQRQADLWESQQRPEGLLLRGAALVEAERWAAANAAALTPSEGDYLALCRAARRRAALLRGLIIGIAVAAVVALALAFLANRFRIQSDANAQVADQQRGTAQANAVVAQANAVTADANAQVADQQRGTAEVNRLAAEANARQARARELAAAAVGSLPTDPQRGLTLTQAAAAVTSDAHEAAPPAVIEALEQAAVASRVRRITVTGPRGLQDLAISPDGTTLATAGNDGVIRIFAAAGGGQQAQIIASAQSDPVLGLAFSPDGTSLAAGVGPVAQIWDVASRQERTTLQGHGDTVLAVAFSPDGKLLASASADGTARLWDATTGAPLRTLDNGGTTVDALAFSPDGKSLATGDGAGKIGLWDVAGGKKLRDIPAHQDAINGLAFSPDGATLASGSADLTVRLWNPSTGTQIDVLRGHTTGVERMAFSPDGTTLASTSEDGTARLWAVADARQILTLAGHTNGVTGVAFSPDGTTLYTDSIDGSLRTWDLSLAPADGAYAAAFSPDGKTLATLGVSEVQLWDSASSTLRRSIRIDAGASVMAYRPDGTQLAVGTIGGDILLIATADGTTQATLTGHSGQINRLAYRPDGAALASASDDKTVRLWDVATGLPQRTFPAAATEVTVVAFSPDGQLLASASAGVITIRDAAGAVRQRLTLTTNEVVQGLAFSPDGKNLAAGDDGGALAVWAVADGAQLASASVGAAIKDLAYSPDGAALATAEAGSAHGVSLWAAADLRPLRAIPHPTDLLTVSFSPDGRSLASAASDGIARVFPLPIEDLLALAKQRTARPPSADECTQYGPMPGCP